MQSRPELLRWSFVAILVGGLLILVGGVLGALMAVAMGMTGMMGMMGMPMHGPVSDGMWPDLLWAYAAWSLAWGVATGAACLLAAFRIRSHPLAAETWGIVAIVAGALSLLAAGGFVAGAAAAILGGALAVLARRDENFLAAQRPDRP